MYAQNQFVEEGKLLWYKNGNITRLGFLQGRSQHGNKKIFVVADIKDKRSVFLKPEDCWPTKIDEVQSGLLGICCTHPSCGPGTIVDEHFNGELYVTVRCHDGLEHGFSLREIKLCCFFI